MRRMTMNKASSLDVLEALADAAARDEEEHGRPTPASRAAANRYHALIGDKMAEMRRKELDRLGPVKMERQPIADWLLAMPRDALLAMLNAMREVCPSLGFAHHKLTKVTDDDLRTMIQDARSAMGEKA